MSVQLRPDEGRLFGRQFDFMRFARKVTRSCRIIVTKFASIQLIPVIVEFLSNTQPEHLRRSRRPRGRANPQLAGELLRDGSSPDCLETAHGALCAPSVLSGLGGGQKGTRRRQYLVKVVPLPLTAKVTPPRALPVLRSLPEDVMRVRDLYPLRCRDCRWGAGTRIPIRPRHHAPRCRSRRTPVRRSLGVGSARARRMGGVHSGWGVKARGVGR